MEQQFSLSWNNFHGNLSRGFAGLLGKGEFVDVSLAVEGHILQAHKVVLSICSPYFKKMFQTNPCQHPIVVLRDVTHKAMKDLLQFMYHGEVSVKQEDLTSFIGTAEVLQIKGLTNKEMDDEQEEEMPKQVSPPTTNTIATAPRQALENLNSEDLIPNEQIDLQRQLMERLNKLTALKRKSDEYMKSNFDLNSLPQQYVAEKRPKLREKQILNRHNISARRNSFEMKKNNMFDEVPTNMSTYVDQMSTVSVPQENHRLVLDSHDYNDNKNMLPSPDQQMMKVEFEDGSELTMADMAQSDSSKLSEANDSSMDRQNVREVLMTPPIQEDALSLVVGNGGTENQSLPLRYKYIYSRKGHKQLVHMNFVYTKHSTSHGKTSWRCVQYFSLNRCPATVETVEAMIYAVHHHHNHEDCFDKIAKNSVYEMTSAVCKE